ncbi:MAG: molybdenum cofactor guanylyltransferase [bacterium]|nr:molybdenum cofactor guanylyltransferase [bacterium]
MTSIILAGGKGNRIGKEKAFIKIGNKTIIERIIDVLSNLFEDIIVVAKNQELYKDFNVKVTEDIIPNLGPLGGLYSGLLKSNTFHNLVLASDMPFINPSFVNYMKGKIDDYDILIPAIDERTEPLHAIYSKRCLEAIKNRLDKGLLSMQSFFSDVKVRYILKEEIESFDPNYRMFFNVNTKDDVEEANRIVEEIP